MQFPCGTPILVFGSLSHVRNGYVSHPGYTTLGERGSLRDSVAELPVLMLLGTRQSSKGDNHSVPLTGH